MPSRFAIAMILYGVFCVIAIAVLDGKIRLFILIFLAALALRTYIARRAGW